MELESSTPTEEDNARGQVPTAWGAPVVQFWQWLRNADGRSSTPFWLSTLAVIFGLVGGALGLFSYFQNGQIAKDTQDIGIVESRVVACFNLSAHHLAQDLRDEELRSKLNSTPPEMPLLIITNGEVGEERRLSSNFQRYVASVKMGRELNLCLALKENVDDMRACVDRATLRQPGKQVFDALGEEDEQGRSLGVRSPAC
ncbi:hypothetical protein [Roseibium sp. Sym1]|uniref:hypothetical protein n=1 Tax=Roseibium sp. Sym1 TaxID=3016006 RepID=UPI0022B2DF14|nr:hypothetical protein [Roseibium sp. Sym1]